MPGTRECFVLTWLLAEQSGYPAHLTASLQAWIASNPYDSLGDHYRNRRKLIEIRANPDGTPVVTEVR